MVPREEAFVVPVGAPKLAGMPSNTDNIWNGAVGLTERLGRPQTFRVLMLQAFHLLSGVVALTDHVFALAGDGDRLHLHAQDDVEGG